MQDTFSSCLKLQKTGAYAGFDEKGWVEEKVLKRYRHTPNTFLLSQWIDSHGYATVNMLN
jgi:hypothetical protein